VERLQPSPLSAPVITSPADGAVVGSGAVAFAGTAAPGATVSLFTEDGAQAPPSTQSDAGGHWALDDAGLAPGTYTFAAQAFTADGESPASAPVRVTVAAATATPTATATASATSPPAPSATATSPPPSATPAATAPPPPSTTPSPVAGRTLIAQRRAGTVLVKVPGRRRPVALGARRTLPVGATVDATRGRVRLVAAAGRPGATQTADVSGGVFTVTQTNGRTPVTQLRLAGGRPACARPGRATTRELWVSSPGGGFRTRGLHSAATGRSATWLTRDSCAGTLTRVTRGTVEVQDLGTRRAVVVRSGHRYLARSTRR
jgi:hypothetical protein